MMNYAEPFFMSRHFFSQMIQQKSKYLPLLLTRYIYYVLLPSNFTLDPYTFAFPLAEYGPFEEMYIVSLFGHEKKFPAAPEIDALMVWINGKLPLLHQGCLIGGWYNKDDHIYYLDLSSVIYGLENAKTFGELNRQKAIYHPYSDTEIGIGGKFSLKETA